MSSSTRRILAVAAALLAGVLAVVWLVVVPEQVDQTTGLRQFVIRWGHPACWGLLSLTAALVAVGAPRTLRNAAAAAAGICYAAFLGALVL